MLHRFMLTSALFLYALISSAAALAMTSVCSGEVTGSGAVLRHEATWSIHDNWFHNLYLQMSSEVQGPQPAVRVDTLALTLGGQHVHQLPQPQAGHYTMQGQLQVGYPLAWGFDAYYSVAC